jgi:hypothetical protein
VDNHPALVAGINEAVGDTNSVVIGWCLVAAFKRPDQSDETGYFYDFQDGQSFHSTLGLVEVLRNHLTETRDRDES